MASELTPRQARGAALGSVASAGRGADVTTVDFSAAALRFSDIPASFPTGTSLILASEQPAPTPPPPERELAHITRQAPKPFRLKTGDVVQRRTGLAIYPDRVITAIAERPLAPNGKGAYAPTGDWALVRRTTQHLPKTATRTKGHVPADPPPTPNSNGNDSGNGGDNGNGNDAEAQRFPEGADAIAYLPAQVRRSIYARIPAPTQFDGKVVQYQDDHHYEVVVVRADAATCIVTTATRPHTGTTWDVTMLTYDLTTATTHTEGRP